MPRGDGSGPRGMGPMTGRGAGYCAGYAGAGSMGGGFGRGRRGFGMGMGPVGPMGPGMPPFYGALPTEAEELLVLKNQAAQMTEGLESINKRIAELEEKT